jgi:hypothetical protein
LTLSYIVQIPPFDPLRFCKNTCFIPLTRGAGNSADIKDGSAEEGEEGEENNKKKGKEKKMG